MREARWSVLNGTVERTLHLSTSKFPLGRIFTSIEVQLTTIHDVSTVREWYGNACTEL